MYIGEGPALRKNQWKGLGKERGKRRVHLPGRNDLAGKTGSL